MSEKKCPSCGASIDVNATECKFCGESIAAQQQAPQYQPPQAPPYQAPQAPYQAQPYQAPPMYTPGAVPVSSKSKTTAGLLGILLGGLGAHKFYLGNVGLGILYLLFSWTFIPAVVGLIEGIIYLTSSDENFYYKYVRK